MAIVWIFVAGALAGGVATWIFAARTIARRTDPRRLVRFVGRAVAHNAPLDVVRELRDHAADGRIDSRVDVVRPGGRLLGTALIPVPASD